MTARADIQLESLTRPQRLMLKKAYAATTNRPLQIINGPQAMMQRVAEKMIDMGLLRLVQSQFFAVVLTEEGFALALQLRQQGWPNTEKAR